VSTDAEKQRLDVALVDRGLAESRQKAQALIMAGVVYAAGRKADKPSQTVRAQDALDVRGAAHPYVSRGALKLAKALQVFALCVRDAVAVDVGASTGGFTDVLLRGGARHVYAVDVGYGQLDWRLRNDARVTVMERTNARYLIPADFMPPPTLAVMDVSFISVLKILPALFAILGAEGACVTLIKPQFEAGRDRVGKKGVVRDAITHRAVLASILAGVSGWGWHCAGLDYSPITGPEGNIEFLAYLRPGTGAGVADAFEVVAQAHATLQIPQ
jgi:23S rRNA (cytidine1920-2'-O)/16S rRNA (cytidine1409-2'-O)-methyltransferase